MNYLEKIGRNAKIAFEDLKSIKHNKIIKVLNTKGFESFDLYSITGQ